MDPILITGKVLYALGKQMWKLMNCPTQENAPTAEMTNSEEQLSSRLANMFFEMGFSPEAIWEVIQRRLSTGYIYKNENEMLDDLNALYAEQTVVWSNRSQENRIRRSESLLQPSDCRSIGGSSNCNRRTTREELFYCHHCDELFEVLLVCPHAHVTITS